MSAKGFYRCFPLKLIDSSEFRRLSKNARSVFIYLSLNLGPWGIVVWYIEELLARLAAQSGFAPDEIQAAISELETSNWIAREDNVIASWPHLRDDPNLTSQNEKHRKSCQRFLGGLPQLQIVREFGRRYSEWVPIEEARAMGIEWVCTGNQQPMAYIEIDSDSKIEIEKEEEVTTSTAVDVRKQLLETDQAAYDRLIAAVPDSSMWNLEIASTLKRGIPAAVLGRAVTDFIANGKLVSPNLRQFRRYVDHAVEGAKASSSSRDQAALLWPVMLRTGPHRSCGVDEFQAARDEALSELPPELHEPLLKVLQSGDLELLSTCTTADQAIRHIASKIDGPANSNVLLRSRANGNHLQPTSLRVGW